MKNCNSIQDKDINNFRTAWNEIWKKYEKYYVISNNYICFNIE